MTMCCVGLSRAARGSDWRRERTTDAKEQINESIEHSDNMVWRDREGDGYEDDKATESEQRLSDLGDGARGGGRDGDPCMDGCAGGVARAGDIHERHRADFA